MDNLAGGRLRARRGEMHRVASTWRRSLWGCAGYRRGAAWCGRRVVCGRLPGRLGHRVRNAAPGSPPSSAAAAVDPHRAAALVGKHALVLERIANEEGVGCVKIDGEVWTARSYAEDAVIDPGEQVEVVEIRGATALVMR